MSVSQELLQRKPSWSSTWQECAYYVSEKVFKIKVMDMRQELCETVSLNQSFSNSSPHQNPLEDWFTTQISGFLPRVLDSRVLGWGLRVYVSNKFPGDAMIKKPHLENHCFKSNNLSHCLICLGIQTATWARLQHILSKPLVSSLGFYSPIFVRVISC